MARTVHHEAVRRRTSARSQLLTHSPRLTPDMTRRILTPLALTALLFGSWSSATRANGAVPAIAALALGPETTALRVDGELNDEAWAKAPMVKGFVQRQPSEGAPASHDTEVRIAYDATALYLSLIHIRPRRPAI